MTIKTRNRLNNILFFLSLAIFVLNLVIFIICAVKYPFFERYDYSGSSSLKTAFGEFIFGYKTLSVYISLFFMNVYVCITAYFITHAFEKTQSTEISFFSCFLLACLAETSRLYIPMFEMGDTSSTLLILIGNFSAFARILVPLSLLFSVIMSVPEQRQNLERNLALILVSALFFAVIIPLNTSVIEPSFRVHIGFNRTIVLIEILTDLCAVVTLVIYNITNRNNQRTAIGMGLLIAGFIFTVNGTNFFKLILGMGSFSAGTYLYLKELHNQHLYD